METENRLDLDLLDILNNAHIGLQKQNIVTDIKKDTNKIVFSSKETFYYNMVKKYFKTDGKENIQKMLDIINSEAKISLRLLDWFITRYADEHKTRYTLDSTEETFNVHISYKAQLRSYKKKYFDPFRRRNKKFYFSYVDASNNKQKFFTTIGQLNFFRWAFVNGLINYVETNRNELTTQMNKCYKDDKVRKQQKKIDKQLQAQNDQQVNVTAKKKIENGKLKITIKFD